MTATLEPAGLSPAVAAPRRAPRPESPHSRGNGNHHASLGQAALTGRAEPTRLAGH
jgi:hypothetical protein